MLTYFGAQIYTYPITIIYGGIMSKQTVFRLLTIVGVISFIVFLVIAYSPVEVRPMPVTVVGAICFFIFFMVGIPSFVLADDPNAISWTKKHTESKK